MPSPSDPNTTMTLSVDFKKLGISDISFPIPVPMIFQFFCLATERKRGISETEQIFIQSTAPEDTLATAEDKGAVFLFGKISPSIFKNSATRSTDPKFCGSVT